MNTLKMECGLWGEGCILCMCKDFIGLCIIIVLYIEIIISIKDPEESKKIVLLGNISTSLDTIFYLWKISEDTGEASPKGS